MGLPRRISMIVLCLVTYSPGCEDTQRSSRQARQDALEKEITANHAQLARDSDAYVRQREQEMASDPIFGALLDHGASPAAKNAAGATVLDMASTNGLKNVVKRINLINENTYSGQNDPGNNSPHSTSTSAEAEVASSQQSSDRYVRFSNAGLELIRPEGFAEAVNFDGFQQPEMQSSILLAMIPGPFLESTSQFTVERMQYILIQGIVGATQSAQFLDDFKTMARSLKLR